MVVCGGKLKTINTVDPSTGERFCAMCCTTIEQGDTHHDEVCKKYLLAFFDKPNITNYRMFVKTTVPYVQGTDPEDVECTMVVKCNGCKTDVEKKVMGMKNMKEFFKKAGTRHKCEDHKYFLDGPRRSDRKEKK
jgi:hypothetical protein